VFIVQRLARELYILLRDTYWGWVTDRAPRKSAALAYYTMFSLAPVLVLAIAIAGFFFGEEAVRGEIVDEARGLLGTDGAVAIQAMIASAAKRDTGLFATVASLFVLLLGATSALAELKDGLDQIWDAPPERTKSFWYFLRKRLASVGLILALGFLLLVSLVLSAALNAVTRYLGGADDLTYILQVLNYFVSFVLVMALFATIYKVLPSVRIAWRDVAIGAVVTAALFSVGKYVIGLYLGNSAITSSYGAAGSLVVVLIWVYYSALILFFGAEFTKVYAHRHGSRRKQKRADVTPVGAEDGPAARGS
jgi:membrane protein